MIDFRYHLISIVAIFLALAVGIALGAGPLKGGLDQQLVNQAEQDREDKVALRAELDQLGLTAGFQDDFAQAVAPDLLDSRLEGRTVAVVLLPGADPDIAAALADDAAEAGGTVTGTIQVQPGLVDPQNRQVAEGLATSVLDGVSGGPDIAGASSYQLVGYSLARGFLSTRPQGAPVDVAAQTAAASYREAGYVTTERDVQRRAGLAVVITAEPEQFEPGQDELVTTLVQAMDAASGGVVVAGSASSGVEGGYVQVIRSSDVAQEVSTVDVADTAAGRVATVLALAEQAAGRAGQYGSADAADGALPGTAGP
ncbi:MAG: copper transporter [Actinomycetota bacterium]|nr:copper transporter [Actinomycetota bacterium]